MSRRRQIKSAGSTVLISIVRLWILRLLFPLGLHCEFVMKHDFNSEALAEALGLHEWIQPGSKDFDVLAVLIHSERLLDDLADALGNLSTAKASHALSVLLDLSEHEVRNALSAQGVLARSGLVAMGRHGVAVLRSKLHLLSDRFADTIASTDADPISLLFAP